MNMALKENSNQQFHYKSTVWVFIIFNSFFSYIFHPVLLYDEKKNHTKIASISPWQINWNAHLLTQSLLKQLKKD